MTDPFDVLRSHVRSVALLERPTAEPEELIEQITTAHADVIALRSPRRRRWWAAGAATAIVVVGGAGVAAFRGTPPDERSVDVLCRLTSEDDTSAVAVFAGDDPVGACAELWRDGAIGGTQEASPVVPRLVACTGPGRPIEVLPLAEGSFCADVGLVDADVSSNAFDPVVLLQVRLGDLYGSDPCESSDELVTLVNEEMQRLGLTGWTVRLEAQAPCALAAVEVDLTLVRILPDPLDRSPLENP